MAREHPSFGRKPHSALRRLGTFPSQPLHKLPHLERLTEEHPFARGQYLVLKDPDAEMKCEEMVGKKKKRTNKVKNLKVLKNEINLIH